MTDTENDAHEARAEKGSANAAGSSSSPGAEDSLARAWLELRRRDAEQALALADAINSRLDPQELFEAALLKAEALRGLRRDDEALSVLRGAMASDGLVDPRLDAELAVLASCEVALIRFRAGERDDAIALVQRLSEWLGEHPQTTREWLILSVAANLCWIVGSYQYYAESLVLARAITERFEPPTDPVDARLLLQTRLMQLISMRNLTAPGSDDEASMADEVDRFLSGGEATLEVLDGWTDSLREMGGPKANPQLVMAAALQAMTLDALGEHQRALTTIDACIEHNQSDDADSVQAAVDALRLIRANLTE